MLERLALGFAVVASSAGCEKHETSAPHTTVTVDVRGERTTEIDSAEFADGWSVKYDRFWLSAEFGLDETIDHHKPGDAAPVAGSEAYVYGGAELDLSAEGSTQVFYGWLVAGRSGGWGMHLRNVPREDAVSRDAGLEVAGQATGPAGETLRFDWRFTTQMTFAHCVPSGVADLILPDDGELGVDAVLDGASLFGEKLGRDAALRFEPLARADRDADGTITTVELRATELSELDRVGESYRSPGALTLHDFLTARLVELVAPRYTCQVQLDACQDRPWSVGGCDRTDLAEKDFDGDGLRNCADDDIDGDALDNQQDCDAYHSLASLSLCDGSDQHEKDTDHDGSRNCDDEDIDGDGIANERDGRPYESQYARDEHAADKTD
jgi:hypothetical protein